MRQLHIYLKSGLSLEYEVREGDVYQENEFLQIEGWKVKYQVTETDEGEIRSKISEKQVKALIALDQIEFYEIVEI